jgi:hypothetical protein
MTTMDPSPEQVAEWQAHAKDLSIRVAAGATADRVFAGQVARLAYAAGADAELEACVHWLEDNCNSTGARWLWADQLRAARRPKPHSLKQQALRDLDGMVEAMRITWGFEPGYPTTIRQALDSLPDD